MGGDEEDGAGEGDLDGSIGEGTLEDGSDDTIEESVPPPSPLYPKEEEEEDEDLYGLAASPPSPAAAAVAAAAADVAIVVVDKSMSFGLLLPHISHSVRLRALLL